MFLMQQLGSIFKGGKRIRSLLVLVSTKEIMEEVFVCLILENS
jgi:geranylgeranyl pyrophosphate synthase